MSCERKNLAYWHDSRDPAQQRSKFWYKVWCDAGYPSSGVLFQLMKHAKQRYKYKVRRLQHRQEYLRHERMAEALLRDPTRDFWSEVCKSCGKTSATSAPIVDGISGVTNVVNFYHTKFEKLLNTSRTHDANFFWMS